MPSDPSNAARQRDAEQSRLLASSRVLINASAKACADSRVLIDRQRGRRPDDCTVPEPRRPDHER